MGTRYHLPLALIGKPTGDGRQFAEGALTHRDLPLPYRYVHADSGGHKDAVIVGRIDTIDPRPEGTQDPHQWGSIEFYDDEDWPDAVREMAIIAQKFHEEKVIGPSVDLDSADSELIPDPTALQHATRKLRNVADALDCGCDYSQAVVDSVPRINLVRSGRVASATSVHIPAFAELSGHAIRIEEGQQYANGQLLDPESMQFKAMDMIGGKRVNRDEIDTSDFGDPDGRKFPITNQRSVDSAAHLIGKAADPEAVKKRIVAICKRKGLAAPVGWVSDDRATGGDSMTAGASMRGPIKPPAAWFANPGFTAAAPLTIQDDGRVYGHLALWDSCHVGFQDTCVRPPRTETGYAYFHGGEVISQEGQRISVGHLTYGAGHAEHNLGFRAAAEHYDNSAHTGAVVRAGEDEFGIWVAGAMVADVTPEAWAVMRRSPLSGDWRRVGSNLELVAALHVNTPGFGVPRVIVSSGVPVTLVAGGAFSPQPAPEGGSGGNTVDVKALARELLDEMEAERRTAARTATWNRLIASAQAERERYAQAQQGLIMALIGDLEE